MAAVGILRIFMIMVRFYFPMGASQNESAYGSVPDPFPSPLKMGKGRQRQTNIGYCLRGNYCIRSDVPMDHA